MSRFTRVLAWAFPSTNASISSRARILAAMEGRTYQSPGAGAWGSASSPGAIPAAADCTPAAAAQAPEGGAGSPAHGRDASRGVEPIHGPASPSGPTHSRSSDQYADDLIGWRTPS